MIYTPPKSCPVCEGSLIALSNHKCQDYYDEMQKMAVVTTSQTKGIIYSSNGISHSEDSWKNKIKSCFEILNRMCNVEERIKKIRKPKGNKDGKKSPK